MSLTMADHGNIEETQEERTSSSSPVARNSDSSLRRQLAVAVRSIRWSYAIFWSSSPTQNGVLEWREGYYNGDMKKRKKSEAMVLKAHKFGLQRSKQLRQLYLSMLEGDTSTYPSNNSNSNSSSNKSAALSPDDLSDEEWYYLVCMSYAFSPGQGLPGRALANSETIWLCNAQYAESKLFTRSLLARSASIETVVCFPYEEGVIELGVTEQVAEDHNLLQYIKACLLDASKPECFEKHLSVNSDDDENRMGLKICEENSMLEENFQGIQERAGSEEDLHYRRTVSAVLRYAADGEKKDCREMNLDYCDLSSSFLRWEDHGTSNPVRDQPQRRAQNMLWKILYSVPSMHSARKNRIFKNETLELNQRICAGSNDSSDKRRENEKFHVLRSIIPTKEQIDKESILNDTIKYLKELETRVQELESCLGSVDFVDRHRKINHSAVLEETSDNYDSTKLDYVADTEQGTFRVHHHHSYENAIAAPDVKVRFKEGEVQIEVRCSYREYIAADIMDAISNLHMDAYSVRSHTLEGLLSLNLKAKSRGAAVASAGMIKRELRKIVGEC